jgi:hypothetical protein
MKLEKPEGYDRRYYYYCNICEKELNFFEVKNDLHEHPVAKIRKPKKGYWYKYYTEECVLCGAGGTEKYRQYSPKPDNAAERYDYSQTVCGGHFL